MLTFFAQYFWVIVCLYEICFHISLVHYTLQLCILQIYNIQITLSSLIFIYLVLWKVLSSFKHLICSLV